MLLAAVILLDQFSRNIHRENGPAFAADPLARSLTWQGLSDGWEDQYTSEQRRFLHLPLAHAEDAEMQALSVAKYEALAEPEALVATRDHADVIRRYGRLPSRNEALARPSTRMEILYFAGRKFRLRSGLERRPVLGKPYGQEDWIMAGDPGVLRRSKDDMMPIPMKPPPRR